jgi:hypothetical protein
MQLNLWYRVRVDRGVAIFAKAYMDISAQQTAKTRRSLMLFVLQ